MKISELVAQSYVIEEMASYDRFQVAVENIEAEQQLAFAFETLDRAYKVSTALENISEIISENTPQTDENKEVITRVIVNELSDAGIQIKDTAYKYGDAQKRYEIATEGIGGFMRRIWEAIIAFLKKIKDFIVGLFSSKKTSEADMEIAAEIAEVVSEFKEEEAALLAGETTVSEVRKKRKAKRGRNVIPTTIPEKVISSKTRTPMKGVMEQIRINEPIKPEWIKEQSESAEVEVKTAKEKVVKAITARKKKIVEAGPEIALGSVFGKVIGDEYKSGAEVLDGLNTTLDLYNDHLVPFYDKLSDSISSNIDALMAGDMAKINLSSLLIKKEDFKAAMGGKAIIRADRNDFDEIGNLTAGLRLQIGGLLDEKTAALAEANFKVEDGWTAFNYAVPKPDRVQESSVPALTESDMFLAEETMKYAHKVNKALEARYKHCTALIDKLTKCSEKYMSNDDTKMHLKTVKLCTSALDRLALRLIVRANENASHVYGCIKDYMVMSATIKDPTILAGD